MLIKAITFMPTSKVIGKFMMLIGVIMCLVGAIIQDPALGGIGVAVGLLGRLMDEYFDDWFDW